MSQYAVEWLAQVRAFVDTLADDDRAAIDHLVNLLSQGLVLGERIQSDPIPTYRIKAEVDKTRWPNDLRVFFRVSHSRKAFYIIDVGDHTTSALHPGKSVYPDER